MAGLSIEQIRQASSKKQVAGNNNSSPKKNILQQEIRLWPVKLTDKQKEAFYLELATMMAAGLDIKAALDLVEEEQAKEKQAKIIREIKHKVVAGATLSEAMQQSNQFTPYEYFSVQIGEEIGKLSLVLHELAIYFAKKLKQKRQFISALSYPVLILCTSIGAVSFMLYFIVPMFSDVFKRFGGELPYITQFIIQLAEAIQDHIFILFLGISFIVAFMMISRKKLWFQKLSAAFISKIPLLGRIFVIMHRARFCSSMALLISARVPLLRAIQLVHQMITFYPIRHSLEQIEKDILNGKSLHASLKAFTVYESRMVALIKVGEEVNQLDTFFNKLAMQYGEEVEHRTAMLSTFLEPFMIIFLGLIVGFILIAMYLPMFQLSTSIGG